MKICFDFDGVIHSFTSPWRGDEIILDAPVYGCRDALAIIKRKRCSILVHSVRCRSGRGRKAIAEYMEKHHLVYDEITEHKPVADLYVDDMAFLFTGVWDDVLKVVSSI